MEKPIGNAIENVGYGRARGAFAAVQPLAAADPSVAGLWQKVDATTAKRSYGSVR